ncbi:MAG TPA: hypothetical protein VFL91_22715 [Thermomicrobiales bacterium]|nr:hypothetical protein [Thermomicrobiales bacterium]
MEHSRDPERQTGDEAREQRIKQLILAAVGRCGECRRRYRLDDLAVIGHRDHLWMVTVICEHCHSQGFITAIVEDADAARAERGRAPSDLTADEAGRFAATKPVDALDVLDMHDFLDDFDGDFAALFGRAKGD